LGAGASALAHGFVHDDRAGYRDVERADAAGHGDAEEVVAGALHEVVETGSLAAEDEADVLAEVEVGVVGGAALVEADNPDVLLLHGFEGAGDVDDLGDADVLAGARRGFGRHSTERGGAAFREDDAVDSGSVSRTEERAEVVGIFYSVECEDEFRAGRAIWGGEEVFEGEEFALADEGDDALVRVGFTVASELVAWLCADANALGAGELEDRFHTGVAAGVALAGDREVVEGSSACAEGLFDRVQAVQNIHCFSVKVREALALGYGQDEAGRAAVGAKVEGLRVALALETLRGQFTAQAGLAVQENDLVFAVSELRNGGIQLIKLQIDGVGEMAGLEFGWGADVNQQAALILVFAGIFERSMAG